MFGKLCQFIFSHFGPIPETLVNFTNGKYSGKYNLITVNILNLYPVWVNYARGEIKEFFWDFTFF